MHSTIHMQCTNIRAPCQYQLSNKSINHVLNNQKTARNHVIAASATQPPPPPQKKRRSQGPPSTKPPPTPDFTEFELDGPGYAFQEDEIDYIKFEPDPEGHKAGFVAIIGRPNAGKSTLMNALLGQSLSIVTEKAQTTRHRILGILSDTDHQVIFLDTPGIIVNKKDQLEERMMAAVSQAVKDSDALLAIVDASDRPEEALAMLQPGSDWAGPPMAIILNKCDLLQEDELDKLKDWYMKASKAATVLCISAKDGDNVEAVRKWVVDKMPEGPSMYPKDIVSEAPERFFVAEIIRRHVFLQYRQEIPYGVAVAVTEFKERKHPAKDLIRASVIVERDRHRGIILGKGGLGIKKLSMDSRAEIEQFLDREVYLELSVKVQEGWRKDPKSLESLGY